MTARRTRLVSAGLAVLLSLGACTSDETPQSSASPSVAVRGAPDRAALDARDRVESVRRLLARRATAIVRHDASAFASTYTSAAAARVASQGFANSASLPLASWRYATPTGGRVRGDAWSVNVRERFAYRGYESDPSVHDVRMTFRRTSTGWRVATAAEFIGRKSQPQQIWDGGPVAVRVSQRALVLGHPGHPRRMRLVAEEVDAAVPRVTAVWGSAWSQRTVVEAPDDVAELSRLVGQSPERLADIAAVATAELAGRGNLTTGNRIVVHPVNFDHLGSLGRQIVITHEVTHVASRAATAGAVPTWLAEGFADYVAYRDSGVPTPVAARELAAEVRAGRTPKALPDEAAFRGGAAQLAIAYEGAWLAVRLIVEAVGEPALLRFYRALGRASGSKPAALRRALATTLHTTPASFTAAWRRSLEAKLQ